jgi:hypothetical protein
MRAGRRSLTAANLDEWRLRKNRRREREQEQAQRYQLKREQSQRLHRLLDCDPEPPTAA